MKKIYFILLLVMTFNVWGDATLSGVVRDGSNNPVADVQVFVVKGNGYGGVFTDYTAVTDANGGYTINIPYGQRQHSIVYGNAFSATFYDFENQSIILEFASAVAIPHRWNDSGGRVLSCALGCASEDVQNDEKVMLGAGSFVATVSDVIIQGTGKIYTGTVFDVASQTIANPSVRLQSESSSAYSGGYLPAATDSLGNYSSLMVPNAVNLYISAYKTGYINTFHDGAQCILGAYCLPVATADSLNNNITLEQAASLVINPPEMPSGVATIDRQVRVFGPRGTYINSCYWYATINDFPLNTCRIEGLLESQQYHVMFLGYDYDENNVSTYLVRKYHNNQQTGCGLQFDMEYFPANGLNVAVGHDTFIDYPELNSGHQVSGYAIDKNTQLPIMGNQNYYGSLYLELLDSSTLDTAGVLTLAFDGNNELTFYSCGSAPVADGSYYLSAANQATYSSFMQRGDDVGDYKRFVYDGIDCQGKVCDFTNATPIVVNGNDVTGIELELEKGSRIEGCFYDDNQTPILSNDGSESNWLKLSANIYSDQYELLEVAADVYQDIGNNQYQLCYSSSALPAGNYYVRTNNGSGKFIDNKNMIKSSLDSFDPSYGYFDTTPGIGSQNCSGDLCVMNTAIALNGSTHVTRDFYLTEGSVISGALKDNVTGSLIVDDNILAELYQNDFLIGQYQFISEYAKFLTPSLDDGNYEIRLSGNANYLNTSLLNRGGQQTSQLTDRIPVTINGASVDIGTITAITDMIFRDGME